jgi:hypothetical protein
LSTPGSDWPDAGPQYFDAAKAFAAKLKDQDWFLSAWQAHGPGAEPIFFAKALAKMTIFAHFVTTRFQELLDGSPDFASTLPVGVKPDTLIYYYQVAYTPQDGGDPPYLDTWPLVPDQDNGFYTDFLLYLDDPVVFAGGYHDAEFAELYGRIAAYLGHALWRLNLYDELRVCYGLTTRGHH